MVSYSSEKSYTLLFKSTFSAAHLLDMLPRQNLFAKLIFFIICFKFIDFFFH